MSLTNEQRAHDIAIASLPIIFEQQRNNAVRSGSDSVNFDILNIYFDTFVSIFKELEDKLPKETK